MTLAAADEEAQLSSPAPAAAEQDDGFAEFMAILQSPSGTAGGSVEPEGDSKLVTMMMPPAAAAADDEDEDDENGGTKEHPPAPPAKDQARAARPAANCNGLISEQKQMSLPTIEEMPGDGNVKTSLNGQGQKNVRWVESGVSQRGSIDGQKVSARRPGLQFIQSAKAAPSFNFEKISVTVKTRKKKEIKILDNVCGSIQGGSLLAVMGKYFRFCMSLFLFWTDTHN